jgi:competence ComEA-like helix-hairpin-helix protein
MEVREKIGVLLLIAGLAAGQELPEGKGKEAVKKVCSGCHGLSTVVGSRRTKIGWERNVDDMVSRGAEGSDEELSVVVEYLTAHFGKINVNTASVPDLTLDLVEKEAQAIVAYRQQNWKIRDFEELTKVPGVSAEKLQGIRSRIAFSL